MPRGARRDVNVTRLLRENGLLADRRSFVGHDLNYVPHLFLRGEDKSRQRVRVFARYKRCSICKTPRDESTGEWHHPKNCDCVGCAEVRCSQFLSDCHRHRTPGFRRKA